MIQEQSQFGEKEEDGRLDRRRVLDDILPAGSREALSRGKALSASLSLILREDNVVPDFKEEEEEEGGEGGGGGRFRGMSVSKNPLHTGGSQYQGYEEGGGRTRMSPSRSSISAPSLSLSSASNSMVKAPPHTPTPTTPSSLLLSSLPLKLMKNLEEKGVIIQASGRVLKTRPDIVLSPVEDAMAADLAEMVKQGQALAGGLLSFSEEVSSGGGPAAPHTALPSLPTLPTTALEPTAPKPTFFKLASDAPVSSPPSSSSSSSKTVTYGSPPLHPEIRKAGAKAFNKRVVEGGQVYFLDGPEGPALAAGWQRFSDSGEGEGEGEGGNATKAAASSVWYVCVAPQYLSETPPPPQWEPPYAPLPDLSTPLPYHPRINPLDKFMEVEGVGRCYLDPISKEPMKPGWRAVTNGVDVWYGSKAVKGSVWVAPLLTKL